MGQTVEPRDDWDATDHFFPDGLKFDGCACAIGTVEGTYIDAHCHRTGVPCGCEFAGVHYRGDVEVARKVADYIANAYRCDVTLVDLAAETD